MVVECVVKDLADKISQRIKIPTIGIGASNKCDGQILVTEDLLGFSEKPPKFVKMYDNFKERTEICIKKTKPGSSEPLASSRELSRS